MVELKNVTFQYGNRKVIENLSLSIKAKEFIAIIGPNGSGKSTLMKIMMGLLTPDSGERVLFGLTNPDATALKGKVGYVPQKVNLNRQLPLTVFEFLNLKTQNTGTQIIMEALEKVGMTKYAHTSLHELSGGQTQRVMMAFSLMGSCQLLCLDEATEGMDFQAQSQFYDMLKKYIQTHNASLVLISHDISAVTEHTDRVICISEGIAYDGSPKATDFHSCLHKIYGEKSTIHDHSHHHHKH